MSSEIGLDHFYLSRYRLELVARESCTLPAFKGTTLRGGFGHIFRQMVCYQPATPTCDDCLLRFTCPYPYLFNTYVPPGSAVLAHEKHVPLPLVIEPPADQKQMYDAGDALVFHVTLIGEAQRYLSYLAVAFQELGRVGLGSRRGRFDLSRIDAEQPYSGATASIYDATRSAHAIHAQTLPVFFSECVAQIGDWPQDRVVVQLQTPVRLVDKKRVIHDEPPPFHVLWRALMRRVSSLAYFHCGQRWETDYRGLVDSARKVQIAHADTHWVARNRYSGRQQKRVPIGGTVGTIEYVGDLNPFLAVLELGRWVHAGKATVFGNGKLALRTASQPELTV